MMLLTFGLREGGSNVLVLGHGVGTLFGEEGAKDVHLSRITFRQFASERVIQVRDFSVGVEIFA